MFRNNIRIAWRNLRKNSSYTFINILGLSSGIACAILIYTLVSYQLSFDRFNPNANRVYRVVTVFHEENTEYQSGVPQPLGKAFLNDYSYTEAAARVCVYNSALISLPYEKEAKKFEEEDGIAYADPGFFDIFRFPLVKGAPGPVLTEPNTALITRQLATKYFGSEEPIGKIIRYNNKWDFRVTGILKDIPNNTDRRQEIYLSYINLKDQDGRLASDSSWGQVRSGMNFFIRLKPGVAPTPVEQQFPSLIKKYDPDDVTTTTFRLQPLTDIHFNTDFDGAVSRSFLWAFSLIGVFLIITACVNFINLATARALNRAKEVGIRKVMGSLRAQLFWQFIFETSILVLFAFVLACGLAILALPAMNQLMRTRMTITAFTDPATLAFLLLLLIAVVFLAGSYPALILSKFRPITALKGKLSQRHIGGFSLRRILVVTQFTISQMLIIGVIVIAGQMHYSETSDLGFRKDGIVLLPVPQSDPVKMATLSARMAAVPGTEKITLCSAAPASSSNNRTSFTYDNRPKEEPWDINMKFADAQYVTTYDLRLVAGRNIFPNDTAREVLVNEAFVRSIRLRKPSDVLGKHLTLSTAGSQWAPMIAGVVRDFHNYSMHSKIDPVVIAPRPDMYRYCSARINIGDLRPVMAAYEKIWNETYPEYVYSAQFLDERIARFYRQDTTTLRLVEIFSGIAILISCLGLYGLVSFMAQQKTKEIGVRKVLGAGVQSILWLFGKEFSRLLLIAFLIAAPVAGYVMARWLQSFEYRISLTWTIFAAAIVSTFGIAMLTVAWRSVKAALANPVTSLRSE
ncbi:MAG TPA: ABC transporter permease [Puia sp.]|jgi:ABC-type antimicrobial peptide transport system permease subunit|nr:ABC transporter permease [Puia sp.]